VSTLLDAYLMFAWLLCFAVAVALRKEHRKHGCLIAPIIVLFALGWPVILPVVAVAMWRKEAQPPAR
jgi:hypothetical protein